MAMVCKLIDRPRVWLGFKRWRTCSTLGYAQTNCISRHSSDYRRPGVPPDNTPPWEKINFNWEKGVQGVKKQFGLLKQELVDKVTGPEGIPLKEYVMEQTRVFWEFRSLQDLDRWIVSSDQEVGGKSVAYLKLSKNNQTALLYGNLNTEVPRDGETRYSGYCSMRARPPEGSFNRKKYYDWTNFNTLVLRIRGDGRPWMVNLVPDMYFSHQRNDLYNYFLYTRGGPYWQDVKIPFSKFFLSSKGRVQDSQYPLYVDKVSTVGFTIGDQINGPFQLEIDFIGLCNDRAHTEEFAYEKYKRNPESKRR